MAAALDVPTAGGGALSPRISAVLRSRRLLLLLDNFEHVLDAWPLVVELLSAAPGLTVLVTSRTALGVTGEQVYVVPPLSLPVLHPLPAASTLMASDAASLFLERARLADHAYRMSEDQAEPVARICHRLDGLPLALELAAARILTFSPTALLTALNDALGLLTGGPRDVTDRQRTLRGAIAWSYELLTEEARQVFIALGVFCSAPHVTAIAAVLDQADRGVLDRSLQSLARASLVRVVDDPSTRVVMLKTVRDFAVERLSAHPLAATYLERHAPHYLRLAEATAPALGGPSQLQAYRRLDEDRAEFDAALEWAVGPGQEVRDGELSMRLVGALWHYWEMAGHVDPARQLGERLLDKTDRLAPGQQGAALVGIGTLAWLSGDYQRAAALHRQAAEQYRAADDRAGVAWALVCLATQEAISGQPDASYQHAMDSLHLARQAEAPRTCACALMTLGQLAPWANEHSAAERRNSEALALARQVGDRWLASAVLINIADVAYSRGDYSHASAFLREVLDMAVDMHDRHISIYAVEAVAELVLGHDQYRRAVHLLAAAARWRTERAQPLDDQAQQRLNKVVHQARAAVGAVTYAVLWAEGQRLTLDEAVALARTGS